jgi:hypothetical protein
MKLVINEFPNRMATIKIRVREEETASHHSQLLGYLYLLFDKVLLLHTAENQDTWEPAHNFENPVVKDEEKNFDFMALYKDGILILGKDTDAFFIELLDIRAALIRNGYKNATLLKLINDVPSQSLSQKVKMWGLGCKFTIIVDRKPSGHLNEFEMLKNQDTIIVILREKNNQSTFMMEKNPQNNLIKIFEYNNSPLETLYETVKWAEDIAKFNEDYYNKTYP